MATSNVEIARLYAGGPGSGCDPSAAQRKGKKCGRPKGKGKPVVKRAKRRKPTKLQMLRRTDDETMMRRMAENKRGALKISGDNKKDLNVMKRLVKQKLVSKRFISNTFKLTKKGAATAFALRRTETGKPQRMVKLTWKSPTGGYTYTQYEMSKRGMGKGTRGPVDLTRKAHDWRGNFRRGTDIRVRSDDREATSTVFEAGDPLGKSSTIMVFRDIGTGKLLVSEFTKEETVIIRLRKFEFKNFIKGQGFLKRRYGVSLKVPRETRLSDQATFKWPKGF